MINEPYTPDGMSADKIEQAKLGLLTFFQSRIRELSVRVEYFCRELIVIVERNGYGASISISCQEFYDNGYLEWKLEQLITRYSLARFLGKAS
jgi:hypothetical protein